MVTSTLGNFGVSTGVGTGRGNILQPKTKWKFRVLVTNFGLSGTATAFTQQVMTCTRPKVQFAEGEVHSYNSTMYYQGKGTWNPIQIAVRDDVSNSVSALIDAQLNNQMNFTSQTTQLSGADSTFQTYIQALDGGDGIVESWFLEGCFISDADYEGFDYSSSEGMSITMTIRYQNATKDSSVGPISDPGNGFIA